MRSITVSKVLTVGIQPVFIGWLDQWHYTDDPVSIDHVPLSNSDVSDVLFSLFKKTQNIPGLNTITTTTQPVKDYQNVSIGNGCIKPEFRLNDEFFTKMQIAPMNANFIYIPENEPLLFETPGLYVARFEIVAASDNKKYPYALEMTVL